MSTGADRKTKARAHGAPQVSDLSLVEDGSERSDALVSKEVAIDALVSKEVAIETASEGQNGNEIIGVSAGADTKAIASGRIGALERRERRRRGQQLA